MADIAIFRINYKSDFILTLQSDAGWLTPFCIKFWTGAPSQAYFAGYDGTTYTHCAPVDGDPTKLSVQFDDHHLPIGDLKFQIGYHFTVADFPTSIEDEVINQAAVIIDNDGEQQQVMLDFNGETAPDIAFSLPAYANEAQRIANEQVRIAAEEQRVSNEQQRISNEEGRISAEERRQEHEQQRIHNEETRIAEFARLEADAIAATGAANDAATLANEKAQLASDKAALAQSAATLASDKAQLAADKAALAQAAATIANDKAALAQQKADYAQAKGDYAQAQGDYAKAQGDIALADHERAETDHERAEADHDTATDDHTTATSDHTQAESDHTRAEADHTTAASDHTQASSDHSTATSDHTQAGQDHTRAESDHTTAAADHTRAESDHAAVEAYVDSLGAFDISAYHATGSVLAKYADLTAALGTNGANIPDKLRKGGMSVKFVLSSDNKYVQYRLMSDSWSIDTNDWSFCGNDVLVDNPEFVYVKTDSEDKILWAIKTDGSIYYGAGVPPQIVDYIQQKINELSLDKYDDIVTFLGNLIDGDTLETLLDAKADKATTYTKTEVDTALNDKVDEVPGKSLIDTEFATSQEVVTNPEYLQVTTDSEGKILSYRDSQGIMHEEVGLQLDNDALQHFYQMLKDNGYVGTNNWSDTKFLELPIPQVCAIVNIGTNSQASAKGVDIITTIEYWDKLGNYFKKPIELNAQGSSSMGYNIKNQAIDFTDGSELKFGNWPAFDSFHIKKYFIDVFRGQCIVCYWLGEQVYQTRPVMQRRPWSYLQNNSAIDGGYGDFAKDYDSGALAHPDGFPIHLFFNGKDAGIYAFNIKKARNNYNCKKNKQNQIILDGILGYKFWNANGDLRQQGEEGGNIWHDFEIRNPKIDKDIDGNKYDGDNPKEPSEDWATCKSNIERLTEAVTAVNTESTMTTKKNKFAEYFNVPFLIDYDLISQVTYNYDGYRKNWIWLTNDGNLWCPTIYDMDSVFGQHWNGASYVTDSISSILGEESGFPTKLLHSLYKSECDLRYKELRDCGIFTADNICNLLDKWISTCGYDNLKNDIENIATSPYLENGNIVVDENNNPILIPNTPSYRDGSKTYLYQPTTNGWYNSIQRVYNWLIARIATLDSYYNYNQN